MIPEMQYFELDELVCPHVFNKYHLVAWQFFDPRLLITIERLRQLINKPVFVNNWKDGGQFSQRGFRCIQCDLVKSAITEERLYVSPHMIGKGIDCDIEGLVAEEVRQWIFKKQGLFPYPLRLESNVSWVHLDVMDTGNKVYLFNK